MKYFLRPRGIPVLLTISAFIFYVNGGKSENFMITSNEEMLCVLPGS